MSPFVTYRDTDKAGQLQYYILQRAFPHYTGLISDRIIDGSILQVPVTRHNLYITFAGCLRGNYIAAYDGWEKHMTEIFHQMAAWYYENRILTNPKKFKRWAIAP